MWKIWIVYFCTNSFRSVEILGDHLSFDHNVFFPQRLLLLLIQVHIHLERKRTEKRKKKLAGKIITALRGDECMVVLKMLLEENNCNLCFIYWEKWESNQTLLFWLILHSSRQFSTFIAGYVLSTFACNVNKSPKNKSACACVCMCITE